MNHKLHPNVKLLIFCMPALVLYFIFKLYPACSGIYYSLTDWNGINKTFHFVGVSNFLAILKDHNFWNAMLFTLKYVIVVLLLSNMIALILAVAIESRPKGKSFFRTVFYMPNMISMVIGGYMWMFIFTKVLYYMADNWGWKALDKSWIGDPHYSFLAIVLVATWGACGYLMIIYMAALQGVPVELKEAAALDGATGWKVFWNITFPLIGHAVTICIFWALNTGFQVFDVIYALTGGGPGRSTQSVAINIYEEAFKGNIRYGYATAKSTVLFLVVMAITVIQLRISKGREQEL